MEIDTVLNFIITGIFLNMPFGTKTSRINLIQLLGDIEGINKQNGVFEIIKKKNAYFYCGLGTRGALSGVKNKQNNSYILSNGVKINFKDLNGEEIVNEILKVESNFIEERFLKLI
jgi:hypothetical protein